MRILKWGIIVTGVVFLTVFIAGYLYLRSTLPDYNQSITLSGVGQEVEIIRDSFGMAHIRAAGDADAYFTMGYCQAQDRLFQMDLVRRAGQGRLAEILGPSLVKVDKLYRTLTALVPLEKWYSQITPQTRAALEAYAGGVNAFLESGGTSLPVEFTVLGYRPEPWRPLDHGLVSELCL
ncbi:MAG: penicillin acylase family protein [Deltaproteobacteria bacterium]|nr:penicillin acylase family protein [Deltaproteobacteria bacterium]